MRKSLYKKYFGITAIVVLISYCFLGTLLFSQVGNYAMYEKQDLLGRNITGLAGYSERIMEAAEQNPEYALGHIDAISSMMKVISGSVSADILFTDKSGYINIIAYATEEHNENVSRGRPVSVDVLRSAELNDSFSGSGNLGLYERARYIYAVPVRDSRGEAAGYIIAAAPMETLTAYSGQILKLFILSAAIVLCVTFFVIYAVTYKMVKPLHIMSESAKRMAEGDFSLKVPVTSGIDEIGKLSIAFNNMAASLSQLELMRRSFIANVSHELKTPMTTIGGFVDGILDGTIPFDKQRKYLETVSTEVKRLSRMITSMLSLSRVEAGELKLRPAEFNISEAIVLTFLPLERMIEEKNITISGLDGLPDCAVFADKDFIMQVIYNLIDNAVKFTNPGGRIDVEVFPEGNRAYVSIGNTGEGIAPGDIPHVFERFYKSDKSRSADKTGTGLGLYIVKTIIDLHKGGITVKSVHGEYCKFTFFIPKNAD